MVVVSGHANIPITKYFNTVNSFLRNIFHLFDSCFYQISILLSYWRMKKIIFFHVPISFIGFNFIKLEMDINHI